MDSSAQCFFSSSFFLFFFRAVFFFFFFFFFLFSQNKKSMYFNTPFTHIQTYMCLYQAQFCAPVMHLCIIM